MMIRLSTWMRSTTSMPVRFTRLFGLLVLALLGSACATTHGPAEPAQQPKPAVLLISIDGFRPDYLDPANTPNLHALASRGVRAEALIPSFPTKTFPNHLTIVTGLTPDHHGIVANSIWDPVMQATYRIGDRDAVRNPDWYDGEPIWVTAERAGLRTAPLFWPGSEAPIGGILPTHWEAFDDDLPHEARIDWVVQRLAITGPDAVRFATLYFSDVDTGGHIFGPESPETTAAAASVDSAIGRLLQELDARSLDHINIIVVSDHGMSPTSQDRVIFLDDYIDPSTMRVADWNPVLALWPDAEDVDAVYSALKGAHPNLGVYRPEEIPPALEFGTHRRVAPVIGIADPGWSLTTHANFDGRPERYDGGNHGYDNASPDMRALFLAAGPAFREGLVTAPFSNTDVYPLIMAILGLPPEPVDGDLTRVEHLLR
jgi:predicted AlkP superfamily pyrophosphatase or phosphodiesterase